MDIALYIIGFVSIAAILWLNVLATIAVRYDTTLETFQKSAQSIFVWVVPILGAATIFHLVWQHYPEAIPESWIPWPFKKLIYGKAVPSHKNRNDDESCVVSGNLNSYEGASHVVGGDIGGGDGD